MEAGHSVLLEYLIFPMIVKSIFFLMSVLRNFFVWNCEPGHDQQVFIGEFFGVHNIILLFGKCQVIRKLGMQVGDNVWRHVHQPLVYQEPDVVSFEQRLKVLELVWLRSKAFVCLV